jgi:hypothetical protein
MRWYRFPLYVLALPLLLLARLVEGLFDAAYELEDWLGKR